METRLQELLLSKGVSAELIEKAQEYQSSLSTRIENILIDMGAFSQEDLPDLYAQYLGLPLFDAVNHELTLSSDELAHFPVEFLYQSGTLPFAQKEQELSVLVLDPMDVDAIQFWQSVNAEVRLYVGGQLSLDDLKLRIDGELQADLDLSGGDELARLRELAFGAPTVNLVNNLIVKGIKLGASDLHIEPVAGRYRARYRVDGVLQEADAIPTKLQLAVISRIKILSGMDIAERRRPQDGKIETRVAGIELDIRCSSLPLGEGESMVMRFLVKSAVRFDLEQLGYEPDLIEAIDKDLKRTTGVILMTGPTGSGKTTSLYSFLNQLNDPDVKIITLEDPIEYQLDGINQVQVRTEIGFDFTAGLRSIVRQDPDILMVGEIRDKATAQIAMQSSLTGHLVFSTVHTNDAPTTYTRLLDLGVEEYLLNASLVSIMAQRLLRTLCPHCAAPEEDTSKVLNRPDVEMVRQKWLDDASLNIRKPVGCSKCNQTGFAGRMAILEYLPCDEGIQTMPKDAQFLSSAEAYMTEQGFRTLKQDGLLKVLKGYTTLEEVLRVAG